MASRSLLAILPIRTSSEVVGIGRAIDSSVRQPGGAQVQEIMKKLCAAVPGAGAGRPGAFGKFRRSDAVGQVLEPLQGILTAFRGFFARPALGHLLLARNRADSEERKI